MSRILYLAQTAIPSTKANSIHVMKMCQAFRQEGHDITLFAPNAQEYPDTTPRDLWYHYGIVAPFPIHRTRVFGILRGLDLDLQGLHCARQMRGGLLYTRSARTAVLSSWANIPTIYEAHDLPGGILGEHYCRHVLNSNRILRVVAITDALKHAMINRYSAGRRHPTMDILVLPDGVDLERFHDLPSPQSARALIGVDPSRFTIGYSGQFYPGRGLDLILELATRLPDVTFLLVGGTPESLSSRNPKAPQRDNSNVILKGFVPNGALPSYLAACDVLLMPYQKAVAVSGGGDTSRWMSPMKMFEYMATGRLIVSSNIPVLREVLSEKNCVLCDPEDIHEWLIAIARARQSLTWRTALGAQAKMDAHQYSWRRRARKVLDGIRGQKDG